MEISESVDDAHHELERCVLFSLTWGVAGLLESDDRLKVGRVAAGDGLGTDEHAVTRLRKASPFLSTGSTGDDGVGAVVYTSI